MSENDRAKIPNWWEQYKILETSEAIASDPVRRILRDSQPIRRPSPIKRDLRELRTMIERHESAGDIPLIGKRAVSSRRSVAFDDAVAGQSIGDVLEASYYAVCQQTRPETYLLWGDLRRCARRLCNGLQTRLGDMPEHLQMALAGSLKLWKQNRVQGETKYSGGRNHVGATQG